MVCPQTLSCDNLAIWVLMLLTCGMLSGFAAPVSTGGEVHQYRYPQGMEISSDYQVQAAKQSIFVQKTPVCSMASFAFLGEIEVAVDVNRPIQHAVIRPLSLGITPTVEGNTLRFRISKPCHLAVEVDGDLHRPLFVFAEAPEKTRPKASDPGVRFFEGGKIYAVGTLELKSNETLYLAGGAVLRGIIRAKNVTGIRILGPGIIDASTRKNQLKLVELTGCKNVEIDGPTVLGSYGWTIVPRLCEDVRVRNVKVVSWRDNDDGFDPDSSRHVMVEHCFFRTKDDCISVKAHGTLGKDRVAANEPPERFNTEDVRVNRCTFWSSEWGHAMTVGFAVSAPAVRNVTFQDCDVIKKEKGPAMSIDNHDLGTAENIRFENIRVEDGCDKLFAAKVAFSEYSVDCPSEYFRNNDARLPAKGAGWDQVLLEKKGAPRGAIRNVVLRNIQIAGDRLPGSEIRGFSSKNEVSDVSFQNLIFQGKPLQTLEEANVRVQNAGNIRVEP